MHGFGQMVTLFYLCRYLGNFGGPFEYNSTMCRELRQEIMDVKVLTM